MQSFLGLSQGSSYCINVINILFLDVYFLFINLFLGEVKFLLMVYIVYSDLISIEKVYQDLILVIC